VRAAPTKHASNNRLLQVTGQQHQPKPAARSATRSTCSAQYQDDINHLPSHRQNNLAAIVSRQQCHLPNHPAVLPNPLADTAAPLLGDLVRHGDVLCTSATSKFGAGPSACHRPKLLNLWNMEAQRSTLILMVPCRMLLLRAGYMCCNSPALGTPLQFELLSSNLFTYSFTFCLFANHLPVEGHQWTVAYLLQMHSNGE